MTIPNSETVWVQYIISEVVAYVITSDAMRTTYYLYKVDGDKLRKTRHSNADPTQLEKYIK